MTPTKYLLAAAIGIGTALSCVSDGVDARLPTESEKEYIKLASEVWEAEGLPSIKTQCDHPFDVWVTFLETKRFEETCARTYCNSPELKEGEACGVGCLSPTTVGCISSGPTIVAHRDYKGDVGLFLHELMHHFSSCAGLGLDHDHSNEMIWGVILPELQMVELDTMTDGGL